jgi:hypothetical protein
MVVSLVPPWHWPLVLGGVSAPYFALNPTRPPDNGKIHYSAACASPDRHADRLPKPLAKGAA